MLVWVDGPRDRQEDVAAVDVRLDFLGSLHFQRTKRLKTAGIGPLEYIDVPSAAHGCQVKHVW